MKEYKVGDVVVCRISQNHFAIYTLSKQTSFYKKWLAIGGDKNSYRISEDDFIDKDNQDNVSELFSYIRALSEYLSTPKIDYDEDKTVNARLFVAAPDMLNALETISEMSSVLPDDKYFREFAVGMCQNAIKKATGEQL
jgi:hypothetical protein